MRQPVHLAAAADGTRLAWTRSGRGPVLVKAANWLTHLQEDATSPVWRHWVGFLQAHFDTVRFDERGCGMSDRNVADITEANWLADLEAVVEAADVREPFVLLGISQGCAAAIAYAIAHPGRVSKLVLYGGYARGWARRGESHARHYHAVMEMMRIGWGSDAAVFRESFTSRFLPDGTRAQIDWYNELCRRTVAPDMAVRLLEVRAHTDISAMLPLVDVPTLVLHARGDGVVPFDEGRRLATAIPGASFVELDSRNHVLLPTEPAWQVFCEAVLAFAAGGADAVAARHALTVRERQVLAQLVTGLSNADIGARLFLGEKTVRNHLSNVYRKLGVASRAQAIAKVHAGERA